MRTLDQQREAQKQQTGKDIPEEKMDQFRDQVWDAIVTQKLFDQQFEKFGIAVTDQEVKDVILGKNPPDVLKRNFIDSTGRFNRQLYEQAIMDPRNKEGILQAEEYVRQSRLNEKLQSMLLASITVSDAEVKRKFVEQNTKISAQFALIGLNEISDSSVHVNDEDLNEYYNNHLDQYKVEAKRKLKYVMFSNNASGEDSAVTKRSLENVIHNIKNDTVTFKQSVDIYSSLPYSQDTLAISSLPANGASAVVNSKKGDIVGPVATPEGFVVYHIVDIVSSNETMVRASHILVQTEDEANKLYSQLTNGADFSKLAKEYSKDPGSARNGGDLGWFGKGAMVPEFEKAAFGGKVGEILKPIKTNFGFHIIKVTAKTNKKYVVERIVNPIGASTATKDANLNAAKDYAYLTKKNEDFEKEGEISGYKVQETPAFTKDAYSVPGIGANKDIIDFAFNNDLNDISEPFRVQSGYVVVQISDITNESVKSFDEVKASIKPLVLREKKFAKAKATAENIKEKINGNLNNATSVDPKVTVDSTGIFTPNGNVPKVGRDYAFTGKVLDLEAGKISEPVKGLRGYYLIKLLSKTPFDSSAFAVQENQIRANLLQQKRSTFFNEWITELKKNADIEDNRNRFFN